MLLTKGCTTGYHCYRGLSSTIGVQPSTLTLLRWTIWRAPTSASKWRMGFNSAFKELNEPKNNNRTANYAYHPLNRVFWDVTPVGKVAVDVSGDLGAFSFNGRRQKLCQHSPSDTPSLPSVNSDENPKPCSTLAVSFQASEAAVMCAVSGQHTCSLLDGKLSTKNPRSINIMFRCTQVTINYHFVTRADRNNEHSLND